MFSGTPWYIILYYLSIADILYIYICYIYDYNDIIQFESENANQSPARSKLFEVPLTQQLSNPNIFYSDLDI